MLFRSQRLRVAIHDAELHSRGSGETTVLDLDSLSKFLPTGPHLALSRPDGTALEELTVFPDGSVTAAHTDVSEGSQHLTLVTSALTGRVRVQ